MAAFAEQVKLTSSVADRLSNPFFAVDIALGRVDDVHTVIESRVEHAVNGYLFRGFIADFRSAESQNADVHIGASELSGLHAISLYGNHLQVIPHPSR
jgi:hypothetical protein